MKIVGSIPKKAYSFPDLLQSLCKLPDEFRHPLFRTVRSSGYLSDGGFLSQMTFDEGKIIDKMHWDALVTDSAYSNSQRINLQTVLPKYLSQEVSQAKDAGGDGKNRVILMEGGGMQAFVEAGMFLTLLERHPNASWWFTTKDYWRRCVVLLTKDGFFSGTLLGSIACVSLEGYEYPKFDSITKTKLRAKLKKRWLYEPYNILGR